LAGILYSGSGLAPQLLYPATPCCFISIHTSTKSCGVKDGVLTIEIPTIKEKTSLKEKLIEIK
jgi:hypothetical protein